MIILNEKFKISETTFDKLMSDLRKSVDMDNEYIKSYKKNEKVIPKMKTKNTIIKIQQENLKLFNDLIVKINDH